MAEKIPAEVFSNTPLKETPQVLTRRPNRQTVLGVYNVVFDRLVARGATLEQDLNNNRFGGLAAVSERVASGTTMPDDQVLIDDFRTLLNTRVATHGRKNLNAANQVLVINEQEAAGLTLTPEQTALRESYQAGNLHLIDGVDYPFTAKIRTDRFTIPARDGSKDFAVIDGASVEGLMKFIDEEIYQVTSDPILTASNRQYTLNRLRFERDVLFTQSTPIFTDISEVTHARNQLEAYYNYQDPLRREWILPDWLNGENLLKDRRVLNIPQPEKGRNRWLVGCLPVLLLLPLPLFVNITTSPCQGTGGSLRVEVFDPSKQTDSISLKGANERELGYLYTQLNQREYRSSDDPQLRLIIDRLQSEDPQYLAEYLKVAETDEIRTAQRIRGDRNNEPWIKGTDFADDRVVLSSCLTPEARSQKARENIQRKDNPRWYDGALNLLERAYQALPKVDITLR